MFTFEMGSIDIKLILIMFAIVCILKFAEIVIEYGRWHDNTLKDLQILSELRNLGEEALYSEYHRLVENRIVEKTTEYSKITLILGIIIRSVPGITLSVILIIIKIINDYIAREADFSESISSIVSYLVAGLILEGLFSILRPFITPLSKRSENYHEAKKRLRRERK